MGAAQLRVEAAALASVLVCLLARLLLLAAALQEGQAQEQVPLACLAFHSVAPAVAAWQGMPLWPAHQLQLQALAAQTAAVWLGCHPLLLAASAALGRDQRHSVLQEPQQQCLGASALVPQHRALAQQRPAAVVLLGALCLARRQQRVQAVQQQLRLVLLWRARTSNWCQGSRLVLLLQLAEALLQRFPLALLLQVLSAHQPPQREAQLGSHLVLLQLVQQRRQQ